MSVTSGQAATLQLDETAQNLLFRAARTANAFTDEPVTDEHVSAIYDLFKWAPTSGNAQPLRLLAIRSEEGKDRLLPHLMDVNRQKSASAPLILVAAADLNYHRHLDRLLPYMDNPAARHADPAFRVKNADFNATLQIGYLILAIRAAGLAAGPMAGFDAAGVDKEFFPDGCCHSLLVINVGRPAADAWMGRLPRLEADEVLEFL